MAKKCSQSPLDTLFPDQLIRISLLESAGIQKAKIRRIRRPFTQSIQDLPETLFPVFKAGLHAVTSFLKCKRGPQEPWQPPEKPQANTDVLNGQAWPCRFLLRVLIHNPARYRSIGDFRALSNSSMFPCTPFEMGLKNRK